MKASSGVCTPVALRCFVGMVIDTVVINKNDLKAMILGSPHSFLKLESLKLSRPLWVEVADSGDVMLEAHVDDSEFDQRVASLI